MLTTTCEAVRNPALSLTDLATDIDALAELQRQTATIEKRARVLRSQVREGMARTGLDAFVTSNGHRASLFESTRFEADRAAALRILSPEIVSAIFKPTTSVTLRVK
jgi:hypothetical protein